MLVFWDQKLVLPATPKTGSTALAEALAAQASISVQRPPLLKHTNVHRFRRFLGPYLEAASKTEWTVVAQMREPLDWLGSWYRFRSRETQVEAEKSTRAMSFDHFVRDWCRDPRPPHADVGSQAQFLRPRQGRGADLIFRYEEADAFHAFLSERLGCSLVLPRVNVSPAAKLVLSAETEAHLHQVAAEDFRLYASLEG